MAEQADAPDLKSVEGNFVRVQISLSLPAKTRFRNRVFCIFKKANYFNYHSLYIYLKPVNLLVKRKGSNV